MVMRTTIVDLLAAEDLPPLLLSPADAAQLAAIAVAWQSMAETPLGPFWYGALALDNELTFQPPGLPIALVIGPSSAEPTIARVLLTSDWVVEIDGLALALRFDPLLLRPLDPARQFAEIRLESGLRLTSDTIQLTDPSARLSLPPSVIPGTGIVVSLDGLVLDLAEESSPPQILEIGYDETFRGVYAESALVSFLPMLRFGGARGLALTANKIAISEAGVTCDLLLSAQIDAQEGQLGPGSEASGELLSPAWPLAVGWAEARLFNSVPLWFHAAGLVRVPMLDLLCALEFTMEQRASGDGYAYAAGIECGLASHLATPFGNIGFASLTLRGTLDDDALTLAGTMTDLRIDLEPLHLHVGVTSLTFAHSDARDELRLQLSDVALGPLGVVDLAELIIVEQRSAAGASRFVSVETSLYWRDLRARLSLPDFFPSPPDSGQVQARLSWKDDATTGRQVLELRLAATVLNVDRLWAFVPPALRPEVRRATLTLDLVYTSAADFAGAATTDALNGALGIDLELCLPQGHERPLFGLLHLQTGDAERIISARLRASVDEQGRPGLALALANLITVGIELPGLPQPEPSIQLELSNVDFSLQGGPSAVGELAVGGRFALRPIMPAPALPIAAHLRRLLAPIQPGTIAGIAELRLRFEGDQVQLDVMCGFEHARVPIDVFDMVAGLTRGFSPPDRVTSPSSDIGLDLPVGFALERLALRLGSTGSAGASAVQVELGMAVTLGGVTADGYLRVSERELALGLRELRVPLRIPRLPLSSAEIEALRTDADWQAAIDAIGRRIAALEGQPDSRRQVAELRVRLFVLDEMLRIRRLLTGGTSVQIYQDSLVTVFKILDITTGLVRIESDVSLVLEDVQFVVPFADPRGIRVEGQAQLVGFAPDDPFRGLNGVQMGLGLSSERIFFSVESLGEPIPLPSFGRYPGGSASLHELTIGYGYTKNSLSITFAGDVTLPPQLIADADTSRMIGAGVRLPSQTSLGFKLDLIPVPGPLPVVPLFEFALDMRSPNAPALVRTDRCQPFWDGLQFVVPGLFRADIKQIGVSPTLGLLPIPNARFDGDLMLGGEKNGVTVIADNMLFLAGLNGVPPIPVPLFANPLEPYFENLCASIRLAGFGLNVNSQRPFPSFSLLALFEVLGLLADPDMPIDPNGHLANTLRVVISDFSLTLPREVLRIFPQAELLAVRDQGLTINLGTFIGALQDVRVALGEIVDVLADAGRSLPERVQQLIAQALKLRPGALLAALPPELRRLELSASLAGFEAHATLLLLDASDHARLVEEFARRDGQLQRLRQPRLALTQPVDPVELALLRPALPTTPFAPLTVSPDDPAASLFRGEAFDAFEVADLDAIPQGATAGVVLGAYVRVFGVQRYRFLGFLFEDGSFGMVTRVDIEPLQLNVAGITVRLPLRASGRLVLTGKSWGEGAGGSIQAQGFVENWQLVPLIPNALRIDIGLQAPASLLLSSDGAIDLRGDVRVLFFGGAATLEGRAEISAGHVFVEGQFNFAAGPVALQIAARGRIGPDNRFELAGGGNLVIAGVQLLGVDARIGDKRAEIACMLDSGVWKTPFGDLPCRLAMQLRGVIDISQRDNPVFALDGNATLTFFQATVKGQGGIGRNNENGLYTYVAGQLLWHGREWLGGRIDLNSNGRVTIQGNTAFALRLTPAELPADIQLASLYLKVDLGGAVTLDASGGIAEYKLKVDWLLGVSLPGMEGQTLALAMQKHTFTGGGSIARHLFGINGFKLLPFDKIAFDLPVGIKVTDHASVGGGFTRTFPAIPVPYITLSDGTTWPDVQEKDGEGKPNRFHLMSIPTNFDLITTKVKIEFGSPLQIQLASRASELGILIRVAGQEKFLPLNLFD